MKLLILGGNGMIGHTLVEKLLQYYEVKSTLKNKFESYKALRIRDKKLYLDNVDILNFNDFEEKTINYTKLDNMTS
tara:strand:+ start:5994 stop:6221 length:228 start_codon:yes stop_codon:yes gene_type:complete